MPMVWLSSHARSILIFVLMFTHAFGCIWWKVGIDTRDDLGWQFTPKVSIATVPWRMPPLHNLRAILSSAPCSATVACTSVDVGHSV